MVRMKPSKQQEVLMVYFLGEVHSGRLQSSHLFVYIQERMTWAKGTAHTHTVVFVAVLTQVR